MYYTLDKALSYNALFYFIIGERGVGKSFNTKKFCVQDFLNHDHQFIYLRRYKEELDLATQSFFDDLKDAGLFEDHEFQVKGGKKLTKFYMDDELIGYGIALSTSNIMKSTSFPKVKNIVFDEFILDAGNYHYLKNECTKLLDAYETVFRTREGRIFFLGNSISIDNPYFNYFDLSLPYQSEFKTFKDGLILVNYIKNLEYREMKRKSRFGKLIDGTDYGRYAIDNEMLRDNEDFIEKKGQNPHFWNNIIINGVTYGVWHNSSNGRTYISEDYEPNSKLFFAMTIDDHTPESKYISIKQHSYIKVLIEQYKIGDLYFENQKVKNAFMKIIRKCLSF